MDPAELRATAQLAHAENAERVRQAEEALAEHRRKEREAVIARQLREWPERIEKGVRQAAEQGNYAYNFEVGMDLPAREVSEAIFKRFAALRPFWAKEERRYVINYDMGTDETYYTNVIRFVW